ncbi:MAG TPA: hypothetical protein VFD03_08930 [Clostridia bacterium]|nr:hypothetical protein [Clostridia bacterium]
MIEKVRFIEELLEAQLFARIHIEEIREYNITTIPEQMAGNCFLDYEGLSLLTVSSIRAWLKKKRCKIPLDKFSKLEIDMGVKVEGVYVISYFNMNWNKDVKDLFWAYDSEKLKGFS